MKFVRLEENVFYYTVFLTSSQTRSTTVHYHILLDNYYYRVKFDKNAVRYFEI